MKHVTRVHIIQHSICNLHQADPLDRTDTGKDYSKLSFTGG
jgi:hypothetical protein